MKKILAHFTDFNYRPERKKLNTFGALGYYRVFKPAKQIKNFEVDVVGTDIINYGTTFEENWANVFKKYDLIWIMHYLGELNAAAQSYMRDKYKKKLVYDIDDNYLDVPESNPVYGDFKKGNKNRAILSATFFFADALTCSTEPLKERLEKHFLDVHGIKKPIFVIPNMNDVNDWNYMPIPKDERRVTIGYAGSNSHQDDLLIVLPVIDKLLSKYPNLYFEVIGAIDKSKLDIYFKDFKPKNLERVGMLPSTPTFWEYPQHLSQQSWDIGIAPLVDTAFTRSKSHIKWMEYAMYKIPTVASRVYPYFMELCGRDIITDGETGYLCRTPADWERTLETLINNKGLREKIGQQAYDHVKENWQYKDFNVDEVMEKILKL